ncbi:MAG: phosphoglycerate dehydrogenase, partial [Eggerthellaceae bacterium]
TQQEAIGGLRQKLHDTHMVKLAHQERTAAVEAQRRAGVQTAEYVAAGLEGSIVPTALNMAPLPPEVMDAVGPYVPACQMMGSILAQMDGEIPQYLKLTASGSPATVDLSILVAGTLKGLLSYKQVAMVTPVNAESMAKRHGIKVETLSQAEAHGYASVVSIVADGTEIACTLAGEAQAARLVSLFGYQLDIARPVSRSCSSTWTRRGAWHHRHHPGEAGINITTMQIATLPGEQCALVYMNVEGDVDDDVLSKLRAGLGDLKTSGT